MSLFQNLTGQDNNYPYYKYIKSPSDMGSSSAGNLTALRKDIDALQSYSNVLIYGDTKAHVGGLSALGNKYFMNTGGTCVAPDGSTQSRFVFINNIPDGIPFLSAGETSKYKGLVPGILGNISYINPFKLFTAFSANNSCQQITMDTRDIKNATSSERQYVLNDDISSYNPCWFPSKVNPVTNQRCTEGMSLPQDKGVQLYATGISVLGIYILFCLTQK